MTEFDAIVVGSGMSGGWCAKELAERGLKVLILERGNFVDPAKDYSDMQQPWEQPNLDRIHEDEISEHYPRQNKGASYALKESNKHFWVKDSDHPYETAEGTNFDWLRGYHLGGRSITWGRQTYRLGPQDFEANKQDGHGTDWPVRYEDIAPWYDHVERFAGISGDKDGLPQLPDGVFQPAFELTCAEKTLKSAVETAFPGRNVIAARVANLTEPTEEQQALGRSKCQVRNRCEHGCSFKAYFSSVNATLPAAVRTGNCHIVNNAIVDSVEFDPVTGRATGVRVINENTRERQIYKAKIIFLNASAIASSLILLRSASEAFPDGLANRSGQVGRNIMDHVSGGNASGVLEKFENRTIFGRRPCGFYIPRYGNITEYDKPYIRGFGYQGESRPLNFSAARRPGIGKDIKEAHRLPGPWQIGISAFGEVLPNPNNRVTLHPIECNKWGMPIPVFDCRLGDNEQTLLEEASKDAAAMLEAAGCVSVVRQKVKLTSMGNRIHEMGTARMGRDPETSVLNGWCQAHDVENLFITDGSFMASAGCQNPSLSYMAFSARAAHHAVDLLQSGKL